MKIGNTLITFDTSYIDNRTKEQERLDMERLKDACWPIIDEIVERGEAV